MKKLLIIIALTFLMTTQVMAQAIYDENIDEFTGEANSFVGIESSSGDIMLLSWVCYDSVRFDTRLGHDFLGENAFDNTTLLYKFDNDPPSPKNKFRTFTNRLGTSFGKYETATFVQKALSSNQVKIRITNPIDRKEFTATFQLAGLDKELPKLPCVDSLESIQ